MLVGPHRNVDPHGVAIQRAAAVVMPKAVPAGRDFHEQHPILRPWKGIDGVLDVRGDAEGSRLQVLGSRLPAALSVLARRQSERDGPPPSGVMLLVEVV